MRSLKRRTDAGVGELSNTRDYEGSIHHTGHHKSGRCSCSSWYNSGTKQPTSESTSTTTGKIDADELLGMSLEFPFPPLGIVAATAMASGVVSSFTTTKWEGSSPVPSTATKVHLTPLKSSGREYTMPSTLKKDYNSVGAHPLGNIDSIFSAETIEDTYAASSLFPLKSVQSPFPHRFGAYSNKENAPPPLAVTSFRSASNDTKVILPPPPAQRKSTYRPPLPQASNEGSAVMARDIFSPFSFPTATNATVRNKKHIAPVSASSIQV
jgi:hypothetical protein